MEKIITLENYLDCLNEENELLGKIEEEHVAPSKETLNNIFNYSKVLSIRKSKTVKHIEMVLN